MKRALLWAGLALPALAFSQGLQPGDVFATAHRFEALNHTAPQLRFDRSFGKPLLLDFWFTSCVACLAGIPKLDSIQKVYGDRLQIVLVTLEKKEKVAAMLKGYKRLRGVTLPVIVEDTLLHRLFPHESVPHKVWIGADGRVRAITGNGALTPGNLAAFVGGKNLALPPQEEAANPTYELSPAQLLITDSGSETGPVAYTFLGGHRPRLATKPGLAFRDSARGGLHIRAVNNTLAQLYKTAWSRNTSFHESRVVFDGREEAYGPAGRGQQLYCFEQISPDTLRTKAYERMRYYLDAAFGVSSSLQKRSIAVYVLKQKDRQLHLSTAGSTPDTYVQEGRRIIENVRFPAIVNLLLNSPGYLPRPVVDETGFTGRADLELPFPFTGLPSFNRALETYGLCLEEATRELEVIVLQPLR